MLVVVRFLVVAGMVVTMLAVGMGLMGVFVARLPAMDVGMLVLMVVGMDMVMLVGMNVDLPPVAVGVLVAMMVRMLVIVAVGVFPFHGALLFSGVEPKVSRLVSILQHANFIVNVVPRIVFSGA